MVINDWNKKRRTTFPRGYWECVAATVQWLARNVRFPSLQKVSRPSQLSLHSILSHPVAYQT